MQAEQPRLAPPERRIIERPRLLKQLEETEARTILLVAPAGYGKTTLARQWERRVRAAWFSATLSSADVAGLAVGLARALSPFAPHLPAHIDEILGTAQNPAREYTELVDALLSELEPAGDFPLVIDDYHLLESSPTATKLVQVLAESESCRLLVSTRTRPRWASARGRIYGETFEIRRDALALNEDEVADLLEGLGPGSQSRADLVRLAQGWPAVIGLAAAAGTPGAPLEKAVPQTLYDFLAEETFNNADLGTQQVLLELALMPSTKRDAVSEKLGEGVHSTLMRAARTGLLDFMDDGIEIHPLARSFLLEKIRNLPSARAVVSGAVEEAMQQGAWDEAYSLIEAFQLPQMDRLITSSFRSLLANGRIETLERFTRYAASTHEASPALIDLVHAEIAMRDGFVDRAQVLAVSAADRLPLEHPLRARANMLGGSAALQRFDLNASYRLNTSAMDCSRDALDRRDAAWGQCLALIYAEDEDSTEAVQRLRELSDGSPEDRVRIATVELLLKRLGGTLRDVDAHTGMRDVVDAVRDPRGRTSFGNICAYTLALRSEYVAADEVISSALADAQKHRLTFALPHLLWTKALIDLGLRRLARADANLRRVESVALETRSTHLQMNARSLRARVLLTQHRPEEALEVTSIEWDEAPTAAMHGEYVATRSLVLAVAQRGNEALKLEAQVRDATSVAEVKALLATAKAVANLGNEGAEHWARCALTNALESEVWDAFICGVRAAPRLLEILAKSPIHRRHLIAALRRSRDESLMHVVGLAEERHYRRARGLTKREREVADLVRQGLTNREIAKTLFISEATAKVHVRHILAKLGARSRAEAVARYPLAADDSSTSP